MYIVFLKFSKNKKAAPDFKDAHVEWICTGVNRGIFCLAGGLAEMVDTETKNALGGAILADNISYDELVKYIHEDPFVIENVVTAEIMHFAPGFASSDYQIALNKKG